MVLPLCCFSFHGSAFAVRVNGYSIAGAVMECLSQFRMRESLEVARRLQRHDIQMASHDPSRQRENLNGAGSKTQFTFAGHRTLITVGERSSTPRRKP
jgi:hypothetical protein